MGANSDYVQRRISRYLLGINIAKRKPLPLTVQDMKGADMIVVTANDVPKTVFDYRFPSLQKRLIIWKIKDEQAMNEKNIRNIVLKIKRKFNRIKSLDLLLLLLQISFLLSLLLELRELVHLLLGLLLEPLLLPL